MGACCRKQKVVAAQPTARQASDFESDNGSLERPRKKRGKKKRRRRRPADSSDDDSSDSDDHQSTNTSSHGNKPQRKSPPSDPYISGDTRYAQDKGRLQQIADDMLIHPPQPLTHSKSYNHSKADFDKKFEAVENEDYLDCVFEGEVEKLQSSALNKPYNSTKRKTVTADNEETTKHTQISEYRLQMGALVNSYLERRKKLQDKRYEEQQRRNADLIFLENLKTRIQIDNLPHNDVVRHLQDYARSEVM